MTTPLRSVPSVHQNQEQHARTHDSENNLLTWLAYVLQNSQGAAENIDMLAVLAKRVPHNSPPEVQVVIDTVNKVATTKIFDDTLQFKVENAILKLKSSLH